MAGNLPAQASSGWTAGRVIALATGSVLLLISFALIAGGGTLAWADQEQLRSGHWGSPRPRPPRCCWLARTGRWTGTSRRPARSRPR
jgi:hypothetical protein